jgi:hypothetical protein
MGLLQVLNLRPRRAAKGASPKPEKLSQAAESWRRTHREANERIAALKASIKAHYADGHPELVRAIDGGLVRLDEVLDNVDHRLADSLASAGKAADEGARTAELKNAKAILASYINYVKSEPLVAHIDQNPFEVRTDLKVLLVGGLTDAAKAIG